MTEESSQRSISHGIPHTYPQSVAKATPAFPDNQTPLMEIIRGKIDNQGAMPFRDYMTMVLYDPEHGYYTAPSQRVGKAGDFITSVSVGRCFGLILARRLLDYWVQHAKPAAFHIIEPGAHDGALCADILGEIRSCSTEFYAAVHYHLVETTPTLIEAQRRRLEDSHPGKYSTGEALAEINDLEGAVISNELVDAFPVDLIRFQSGSWWQLMVDTDGAGLIFTHAKIKEPVLFDFCSSLGDHYPEGYTTEYNPGLRDFVTGASKALKSGLFITIDYGHYADDYYHPDRTTGTLQTYSQHKKADNPLAAPGQIDITSHVDFTRLTTAAQSVGFSSPELKTQASYLTAHARNWLIGLENATLDEAPAMIRQFQTLTHPSMLGTKFMVLEMIKETL